MKVIKNNGEEVNFTKGKIYNAISKANVRVPINQRFTNDEIKEIVKEVESLCKEGHTILI